MVSNIALTVFTPELSVPELSFWFAYQTDSAVKSWLNSASFSQLNYLLKQFPHIYPSLPLIFLDTLDAGAHAQCLRYIFMCWKVTNCKQIPHELQLKIALAGSKGNDAFVVAGTGSGKTLASVLNQLLVESDEVTVMLSPLKRLQLSHVGCNFNIHNIYSALKLFKVESIQALYSIETVAINEDTTNDNIFWEVSHFLVSFTILLYQFLFL